MGSSENDSIKANITLNLEHEIMITELTCNYIHVPQHIVIDNRGNR